MNFCPKCGNQLTTGVRFCPTCGNPVGAAAPPPPPTPTPPTQPVPTQAPPTRPVPTQAAPPPPPAPTYDASQPPPPTLAQAFDQPPPPTLAASAVATAQLSDDPSTGAPQSTKKRRRWLVPTLVSVLAVVGLSVAGLVVWKVFFASAGGASSPEAAVRAMFDAAESQDPVEALKLVNPGEARGADALYDALNERLVAQGLKSEDGLFEAGSIDFSDVELRTENVSDHAVRVYVEDFTATVTFDPAKLPDRLSGVRDAARDEVGDSWQETFTIDDLGMPYYSVWDESLYDEELDNHDEAYVEHEIGFFVMVVEKDGRWYITPAGTWAEYVAIIGSRDHQGGDWTAYDEAIEADPITSESPEDVPDDLVAAAEQGDLAALLRHVPAEQSAVLQPFVHFAQDEWDAEDVGLRIGVDRLDLETEELGDGLVRLWVDALEANVAVEQGGSDDEYVALGLEGECGWFEDDYDSESACAPQWLLDDLGLDRAFVVVREVDGGYQLDPVATLVAYADSVVQNFPDGALDSFIDAVDRSVEINDDIALMEWAEQHCDCSLDGDYYDYD